MRDRYEQDPDRAEKEAEVAQSEDFQSEDSASSSDSAQDEQPFTAESESSANPWFEPDGENMTERSDGWFGFTDGDGPERL